jgi:predicted permease
VFGLGFAVQRLRPLSEQTVTQLSGLVVEILLPCYLFFTTATSASLESLGIAPLLVAMGIVVPFVSYALATLALRLSGVAEMQRSAFRFTIAVANTAFLGIPICEALFGSIGVVYAVLYDFGTTLFTLTFGIWELSKGRLGNWRPLLFNPLILAVLAGLAWSLGGWPFPEWLAAPFETLGNAALPFALLVGGAQVGNIRAQGSRWRRQLFGLTLTRLIFVPLIVGSVLTIIGWRNLVGNVIIIEAAMPVGLTTAIMAKNYGGDAEFAASALMWSTVVAIISLPLIAILLI